MDQVSPDCASDGRTQPVCIGIDVGSTTVKAAVVDPETREILWADYQRHQTKQAEKVLEMLVAIGNHFPPPCSSAPPRFLPPASSA
jgi:activator of 2-hydroxyglutaryl-CoA dehydratase